MKIDNNNVDNNNVDSNNITNLYHQELVKDLFKLKQRMDSNAEGKTVTDYIKYETYTKKERNPTIDKSTLTGFQKEVADMLGFNAFMEYQIKTWEYIDSYFNKKRDKNLIVDAGTGFGKTESVIPALIKKVIDDDALAILIFPRRALLIDQIQRIVNYKINKDIKIGIQISGISPKIEWTIYNNEPKKVGIKNSGYKITNINYSSHTNYYFETDMFDVEYKDEQKDNVKINLFKCSCGGSFENIASFSRDVSNNFPKHKKFVSMNHNSNSYWKCNNCGRVINAAFSREDQITLKPNIVLTTIDSLLSLISDPDMGEYIKNKLEAVVFDEVHVYNSSYGGHASEIITKLNEITKKDIFLAGLSATIDMPEEFGRKLFRSDVEVIEPTQNDIKTIENGETYILIKSASQEKENGDIYSLKTQNMIQTVLLISSSINPKLLAFMDSIDAVASLSRQTNDAYNTKRLHSFRLDDLLSASATYVGLTCNGLSQTCMNKCTIYKKGECWNILGKNIINTITPTSIDIKAVDSESLLSREDLQNSKIIFSTSELQLGIDLPDIEYLLQYGTPYTIFDYLQRRGRAGRTPGSLPMFLFILGESSNDYVYFSYGSNILNKKYILPLEEKNSVVKRLYDKLFKYYDGANNEYNKIKSNYRQDQYYIPKFIASWLSILNGNAIDTEFASFMQNEFKASTGSLAGIQYYEDMRKFKDESSSHAKDLIKLHKNELKNLLAPFNGKLPTEYLESEITEIINEMKEKNIQQYTSLENLKNKVIEDIEEQKDSDESQKNLISVPDALKFINGIDGTLLANKISGVSNTLVQQRTSTLSNNQGDARKLFFTIQSLMELEKAFKRSLSSEVIKYILRANYFYMVPKFITQNDKTPLPVMPPINLFSTSSREISLISESQYSNSEKNTDIRDAIFKYFPFRLSPTKSMNSKYIVKPKITEERGKLYFHPEYIIDPIMFTYDSNEKALMPLSLKIETITDDGVNGIISYCKTCKEFYDYNKYKCDICNYRLSKISLYASNICKTNINADKWDPVINHLHISESSEVTILLMGVDLSINYQYKDKEKNIYMPSKERDTEQILSKTPYGYQITTNSLKIVINDDELNNLYDAFRNKYHNRPKFNLNDIKHTIAHFWLKTIAIAVGVTPDQFSYTYNDSGVIISELQEGGAGYLKTFIDYLKLRTKDVVKIMVDVVNCEEHGDIFKSNNKQQIYNEFNSIDLSKISLSEHKKIIDEITSNDPALSSYLPDEYPICYDGCLYCIGLNSCNYGSNDQFDHLSLSVVGDYLHSLVKETKDKKEAAFLVADGGIIINNDGGNYSIFVL